MGSVVISRPKRKFIKVIKGVQEKVEEEDVGDDKGEEAIKITQRLLYRACRDMQRKSIFRAK